MNHQNSTLMKSNEIIHIEKRNIAIFNQLSTKQKDGYECISHRMIIFQINVKPIARCALCIKEEYVNI